MKSRLALSHHYLATNRTLALMVPVILIMCAVSGMVTSVIARAETDTSSLVRFGLGVIAARTAKSGNHGHDHGVIAPVRTYESPIDRRLEEAGFDTIANVTLLMKETVVRVAEPALVPAGVR